MTGGVLFVTLPVALLMLAWFVLAPLAALADHFSECNECGWVPAKRGHSPSCRLHYR